MNIPRLVHRLSFSLKYAVAGLTVFTRSRICNSSTTIMLDVTHEPVEQYLH